MDGRLVEVHSASEIAGRVGAIAAEISETFRPEDLTVLGIPEDSFVFLADLLRAISIPLRTSFLRYEHNSRGGLQDLTFTTKIDLSGRDVLLVEGVLGTGVPQEYLMRQLVSHGARRVRLCVLVDKPAERRAAVEPDWRAFETQEDYLVGYGLGSQERWRELPYLATIRRV